MEVIRKETGAEKGEWRCLARRAVPQVDIVAVKLAGRSTWTWMTFCSALTTPQYR